jgi:uncharacterized SAM-dependent methyltransferase
LLNRVNTEFDADFVVDKFEHVPNYFEEAWIESSALISKSK